MFPNWLSAFTVSNHGSGFQIPGVLAFCWTGAQLSAAGFSQSGSVPLTM
jgi:hypothetical protein